MKLLFLLSCAVLCVVPLYFVVNSVYQDGVFGRGSLLCISFFSAAILGEAGLGVGFQVPSVVVLLISSFAVFLTWHLCRFHSRILKGQSWKRASLKT